MFLVDKSVIFCLVTRVKICMFSFTIIVIGLGYNGKIWCEYMLYIVMMIWLFLIKVRSILFLLLMMLKFKYWVFGKLGIICVRCLMFFVEIIVGNVLLNFVLNMLFLGFNLLLMKNGYVMLICNGIYINWDVL